MTEDLDPAPLARGRIATLRAELRDDTAFVATPTPRLTWTVASESPDWLQARAELSDGTERSTVDGPTSRSRRVAVRTARAGETREITVARPRSSGGDTAGASRSRVDAGFLADGEWVARADRARRTRPRGAARPRRARVSPSTAPVAARPCTGRRTASPSEVNGARSRTTCSSPAGPATRPAGPRDRGCHRARPRRRERGRRQVAGGWYTEKYGFSRSPTALRRAAGVPRTAADRVRGRHRAPSPSGTAGGSPARGRSSQRHLRGRAPGPATPRTPAGPRPGSTTRAWAPARVGAARIRLRERPVPEARIAPPVRRIESSRSPR